MTYCLYQCLKFLFTPLVALFSGYADFASILAMSATSLITIMDQNIVYTTNTFRLACKPITRLAIVLLASEVDLASSEVVLAKSLILTRFLLISSATADCPSAAVAICTFRSEICVTELEASSKV